MVVKAENRNRKITKLLNATVSSIKEVIQANCAINKPQLLNDELILTFGVLIGITGDVKGKLVLTGDMATFATIGNGMYGLPLEGDMLLSFSGELGNMIAGGLSTSLANNNTNINITTPTIMQGDTKLLGYTQALEMIVTFENIGKMNTYLLLDF